MAEGGAMITTPELRSFLDGLARRFENRPQIDDKFPEFGAVGWGQFLDGPPGHIQVGPYGTCAGIITRALANRGADKLDQAVDPLLEKWWEERDSEPQKFLGQTIRLAMLHLAIRLKADNRLGALQKSIESALLEHVRPDGMWGNFLMPGGIEDPSPRLIATSLVVLSFTLFRPEAEPCPDALLKAVERLEDRILGTDNLPRLHLAFASAAMTSITGHPPSSKARSKISRLAYATLVSLPELGVDFYDCKFPNPKTQGADTKHGFRTDYLIVPIEVVLGIAGYQPNAPLYLRYRAETTLSLLVKNLQGFDGFYRPDNEQRISSLNQCWVAMYLALAERSKQAGTFVRSARGLPAWCLYELIKQRPDMFWLDTFMLIFCGLSVLGAGLLPSQGEDFLRLLFIKLCAAILAFVAGRLYAPVFLKRIFMERQQ
jgi:hypothetical protein